MWVWFLLHFFLVIKPKRRAHSVPLKTPDLNYKTFWPTIGLFYGAGGIVLHLTLNIMIYVLYMIWNVNICAVYIALIVLHVVTISQGTSQGSNVLLHYGQTFVAFLKKLECYRSSIMTRFSTHQLKGGCLFTR